MKKFWITILEWIKNLFLGVKVLDREQMNKLKEMFDNKIDNLFDSVDENSDNVITLREIIKKIKKK